MLEKFDFYVVSNLDDLSDLKNRYCGFSLKISLHGRPTWEQSGNEREHKNKYSIMIQSEIAFYFVRTLSSIINSNITRACGFAEKITNDKVVSDFV